MKLSIRGLLNVIAIFAVVLGWRLDHLRLQKAIDRLNAENTELIERIVPSSGFAFRSGAGTKTVLLNSDPADRMEMLQRLDSSLTHGKYSGIPLKILDRRNEDQR